MLEAGATLRTWRLADPPCAGATVAATQLEDHRRRYLEYEGEISGGRGHVIRWDCGEFDWMAVSPQAIDLYLRGQRVRGRAYLRTDETGDWSFRLAPLNIEY
jgi:hypothetical protein